MWYACIVLGCFGQPVSRCQWSGRLECNVPHFVYSHRIRLHCPIVNEKASTGCGDAYTLFDTCLSTNCKHIAATAAEWIFTHDEPYTIRHLRSSNDFDTFTMNQWVCGLGYYVETIIMLSSTWNGKPNRSAYYN